MDVFLGFYQENVYFIEDNHLYIKILMAILTAKFSETFSRLQSRGEIIPTTTERFSLRAALSFDENSEGRDCHAEDDCNFGEINAIFSVRFKELSSEGQGASEYSGETQASSEFRETRSLERQIIRKNLTLNPASSR